MSTSGTAGRTVSLRTVIEATRRLDELGTARWIEAAAEVVHKAQAGGQPIGKLMPEALVMRDGNVVLEIPTIQNTAYIAPERLRGAGDRRSDVWSLGVMLWEALAHVPLFEGTTEATLRTAVETGEIVPVSEMNANVPAELGAICTKALQRDPAGRYQSAKVMAAEISAVLDDAGYPDGTDAITKWIAKEFPAGADTLGGAPLPVAATVSTQSARAKLGNQTMMGLAPFGDPRPPVLPGAVKPKPLAVVDNKTEPLTVLDIIEHRPHTAPAVSDVIPLDNPIVPLDNPIVPLDVKKPQANVHDTILDARPAFLADKPAEKKPAPGAVTKGWDIPEEPASKFPAAPARAKSDSQAPTSSLPAWAMRPNSGTQQPPMAVVPPAAVPTPVALPAPVAALASQPAFDPRSTLQGVTSNPAIKPPPIEAVTTPVIVPRLKLPDAPPGATINADKPAVSFATTSVVGSSISTAVPGITPAPGLSPGNRTVTMGSNAIIEATNAAISAANPPPAAAVAAPVPMVPAAPVLPASVVGTPVVRISEAETVNTPAITIPRTPTPSPDIRAVSWDDQAPKGKSAASSAAATATAVEPAKPGSPSTAASKLPPPADDDFTDKESSSVSGVSSGKPRQVSRGDKTGKGDVLAGWGWGTDSHTALEAHGGDDEVYEEDRKKTRKRLLMAMGGAVVAVVLVIGIAFATSGGGKAEDEPVAKSTTPIGDPTQAGGGPVVEPPKQEPVKQEPVVQEPGSGSNAEPVKPEPGSNAEPVKPEPGSNAEPVKPEPPKPEPKKPDPVVVKKLEPKKPDPVVIKKPEPKKPDPVVVAKKPEPKKPDPVVVAKKPEPKKPEPLKPEPPKPTVAKVDAASAYKTGFQQYVKGDTSGALTTFKEALASNPGYAPTWRGIGLVYEKLGRRSQAVTAFRRYLELSPNAGDADQIRNRLEKLGS